MVVSITMTSAIASGAVAVWLRLGNMTAAVLFAWLDDTIGEKRARIEASLAALAFFMHPFRCLHWRVDAVR